MRTSGESQPLDTLLIALGGVSLGVFGALRSSAAFWAFAVFVIGFVAAKVTRLIERRKPISTAGGFAIALLTIAPLAMAGMSMTGNVWWLVASGVCFVTGLELAAAGGPIWVRSTDTKSGASPKPPTAI